MDGTFAEVILEIEVAYVNAIRDPNAFSAMSDDYGAGGNTRP